ncbi:uncharacterized protein LOC112342462 isoform X1 [Selaginella moellendorffii]|uniref:uncharacterized protein LOC112342462 isoform X1 n=1 Tax=Selaginella moellendorffii TaxID=88036 RepID=UPI000D1C7D53|nr:uncharacterized protein LOC112342462 isoform X1 [Selaginella moellendorffii]|eukprot:XP_024520079.1 uncharacterized protein LOC112342462 isoform X1 [Selaginella moellendorffii]
MACLALALQPVKGPDVLLQTREWFPPARAADVSSSFRSTRIAFAAGKQISVDVVGTGLGDDALAAASGQVVVGKENKYRVVYRLVNTVYVLGITSAHQDDSANNIFECANVVNQTVSVLVAACKGIDVNTDRVIRKYTEIYMTLDAVLHGVSAARLSFILSSIHGDNVGQIFFSAAEAENRARGADSWNQIKHHPSERLANVEVLSNATFEIPEETIAAGDEFKATLAPPAPAATPALPPPEEKPAENEDPFAASDALTKPESLAGGFKKAKDTKDITAGLSELSVPTVAPGAAESTFVGVEGFEGDYGGLDFNDDYGGGFGDAFEGLTDAFGGGLDASDYATAEDKAAASGLAGLEELEGGGGRKAGTKPATEKSEAKGDLASELVVTGAHEGTQRKDDKPAETRTPLLWFTEEIYAEFKGLVLSRTGLQGVLHLKTPDPAAAGETDTEFSFSLEGAAGIKNGVLKSSITSSLGQGYFHVRTPPAESPLAVLKYRLHPRFTPLPLRMRLVAKKVGFLLSVMIQYVVNPYLPRELKDVTFVLCLPCSPESLKVSPRAALDRSTKELRWQVGEIGLRTPPGRLRAQFPLAASDQSLEDEESLKKLSMKVRVDFSCKGQTLSGISIRPATAEANKEEFYIGEHSFKTANYSCLL